ncbi:MAG: ECF transporter S component [Oscillospiraceae bacterium]|jgi:riboflavin transporter FmnP|nr:ECF transporter S component [Oscillospiraceae bacterium]
MPPQGLAKRPAWGLQKGCIDMTNGKKVSNVRKMVMTALLAALSIVLMRLGLKLPFMPSFITMDFSELPALIASFSLGPLSGAAVCLVKNLVNLMFSQTGGVGELSNFVLGLLFVVPAGLFYQKMGGRKGALIGSLLGAVLMGIGSIFTNYYVVYPVYTAFMPMEAIIGAYQAINPQVENLWDCLVWFNCPFTFGKGMCSVIITFLIYKRISPLIKGNFR